MRLEKALLVLLPAQALAAAVDKNAVPLTEKQMLDALLANPHIMPKKVYDSFSKHKSILHKRQTPPAQKTTQSVWDKLMENLSAIATIPTFLSTGSTAGNGNAPKSLVPEIQRSKSPDYSWAERVKVRYGPFRLPPTSEKNLDWLLWNMEGGATNVKFGITKPCTECTILKVESDIEYADGTVATIKTDALFHHTILFNAGPMVREPTCRQPLVENVFMAGNEKSPTNFTLPSSKIKAGYKVHSSDSFIINTDLQNFSPKEQYVWQTITYEIVDGTADDHLSSQTVWLTIGTLENPSIGLCHYTNGEFPWGPTNLTSKDLPKSKVFSEHSKIWRSDRTGTILEAGGHVHAGAMNIEIFKNHELFCDSKATYGKSIAAEGGSGGHSHGGMGMRKRQIPGGNYTKDDVEFITNMSFCEFPDGVPLRQNDAVHIQANYDLNVHKGVLNAAGEIDQVMGMAGVLVAFNNN